MDSSTVCLVALLMSSLMAAIGKPSHDRSAGPPPYYWAPKPPLPPQCREPARTSYFEGSAGPPHLYRTARKESRGTRAEDEKRDDEETREIIDAVKEFNTFTCVKMRAATEADKDYVLITGKREGCCTNIGRIGGVQELNLEPPACVYKRGCVHHEFMHAAGFAHEHNSPARDKFIRINWENVGDDKKAFFTKMEYDDVTDYGFEYDLGSIMHPSRKAYSKNNRSTIETLDEFAVIGQAKQLSYFDIQKVNIHYGCIEIPIEQTIE